LDIGARFFIKDFKAGCLGPILGKNKVPDGAKVPKTTLIVRNQTVLSRRFNRFNHRHQISKRCKK